MHPLTLLLAGLVLALLVESFFSLMLHFWRPE